MPDATLVPGCLGEGAEPESRCVEWAPLPRTRTNTPSDIPDWTPRRFAHGAQRATCGATPVHPLHSSAHHAARGATAGSHPLSPAAPRAARPRFNPCRLLPWAASGSRSAPLKAAEDVHTKYNLFLDRLGGVCERRINANYEVEKPCKDAVVRLQKLRDEKGARMRL